MVGCRRDRYSDGYKIPLRFSFPSSISMRGAYCALNALFVVASSQIAAASGTQRQAYNHEVMVAGNVVVKSLPHRFLRGSQDVHDVLAHEERTIYLALASMINEGVKKMPQAAEAVEAIPHAAEAVEAIPHAAEALEKIPHAAEAVEKIPHAAEAVEKIPRAAEAVERMPRAAEAVERMPHAAEAKIVKKLPRAAKERKTPIPPNFVKELPHAAAAMEEMRRAKQDNLLEATLGAEEALKKHWDPSGTNAAISDTPYGITSQAILSLPVWKINFKGTKPMTVHKKHVGLINPVHEAFVQLCDENIEPTAAEASFLWGMLEWKTISPIRFHRPNIIRQAHRYVLLGLRNLKRDELLWKKWNELSDPLKCGVLDYLLNLHYQRWVRMYEIFIKNWQRKISPPKLSELSFRGNMGTRSAMALHSNVPFNDASTSRVKSSVLTKRPKRAFNGNMDTTSRLSKQPKTKSVKQVLTKPVTPSDHSVSAKRSRFSYGGTSSAFAPYKPSDPSVLPQNTRIGFGGPSSAFVPYKRPNVHSS